MGTVADRAPVGTLAIAARLRPHCCDDSPISADDQALAVARLLADVHQQRQPSPEGFADTLVRYVRERRR